MTQPARLTAPGVGDLAARGGEILPMDVSVARERAGGERVDGVRCGLAVTGDA
jgi:hypothetical protein